MTGRSWFGAVGWILLALCGQAAGGEPSPPAPLAGIFLRSEGGVTVARAGGGAASGLRPAALLQLLTPGERVNVPAKKRVVILCSSDRWVLIRGPAEWRLDGPACARGQQLPAGVFRGLSAEAGRLRSFGGPTLLMRESRQDPREQVAVVLAPRETALREARPRAFFTALPGAVDYEITWEGLGKGERIAAAAAGCRPGEGLWSGLEVCSAPFPPGLELRPGASARLRVGARFDLFEPPRSARHPALVRRLSSDELESLERTLAKLALLPAPEEIRSRLAAATLAEHGVYGEALEMLGKALAQYEDPALRLAAADLLRRLGLDQLAEREYFKVLPAGDPAMVAAAEEGLGALACAAGEGPAAARHFALARQGFADLGLADAAVRVARLAEPCATSLVSP